LPLRYLDIIPLGSIRGGYLRRDGFTEAGAGQVGLSVAAQDDSSLVSSLGVRLRKDFTGDDTRITIPELKLRWDHEFSRDDDVVNASFAGRPASSFKVVPDRAYPLPEQNPAYGRTGTEVPLVGQVSRIFQEGRIRLFHQWRRITIFKGHRVSNGPTSYFTLVGVETKQ
jgi:hypothetical protein